MCIGTFKSFKGSKEIVKKGFGEVEIQTTDKAQKEKDETLITINSEHSLLLSQLTRTKEESLANLNEINTLPGVFYVQYFNTVETLLQSQLDKRL